MTHHDASTPERPSLITAEEYATVVAIRSGSVVAIPREEYERLGGTPHLAPAGVYERLVRARLSWRSRVMRDRDVALFVIERAATEYLDDLHAAVVQYFGERRAPSRSALGRFVVHVRRVTEDRK